MPHPGAAAVRLSTEVTKFDDGQRLVYGWASVAELDGRLLVDRAGDTIAPEELVRAAHRFLKSSRIAGLGHRRPVGEVVESAVLTRAVQDAMGVRLDRTGWWIAIRVDDAEAWRTVREGGLRALSIAGRAVPA